MIRIPYNGRLIQCSTAAEAIELMKHIKAEDAERGSAANIWSVVDSIAGAITPKSPWTLPLFWKFIESLGETQVHVLSLLVRKQKVTDVELRKALELDSNQALAGVLSGLSKQAGALNVPARSVYLVEDERKDGELTKMYRVAPDFLRIAAESNWVGDAEY